MTTCPWKLGPKSEQHEATPTRPDGCIMPHNGQFIQGAVINVPFQFTDTQKDAVEKAVKDAGVTAYQLFEEPAAVTSTITTEAWTPTLPADRTQLVIDGASSLHLSHLSIRRGLAHVLASHSFEADPNVGASAPLPLNRRRSHRPNSPAVEYTLSASPGVATCSVESLKDGVDFTGSVKRMPFDMLIRPIYQHIANSVADLLNEAGVTNTPFGMGTGFGRSDDSVREGVCVVGALIDTLLLSKRRCLEESWI
ncbi:Hsp70 protein that interacts with Zuo1p [Stygiomarasmius scandens]|uniref:Hsp70 protein that interacts with Zuo1p n=1 Tax=Marasmiellus scandens TaxID=2682957 RepID=A0ABR1JH93_9AGAR